MLPPLALPAPGVIRVDPRHVDEVNETCSVQVSLFILHAGRIPPPTPPCAVRVRVRCRWALLDIVRCTLNLGTARSY